MLASYALPVAGAQSAADIVWTAAIALYERQGQAAVEQFGAMLMLPASACIPCETQTPTFDGCCLVCSSLKE